MTKVGFQGISGSYSEGALLQLFKTPFTPNDVETIPLNNFKQVFSQLVTQELDYALVPIENSSTGTFYSLLDSVVKHSLYVCGEILHHERHCLLALPGATLDSIKEIRSQNYILDQCRTFVDGAQVTVSLTSDPAVAAKAVKDSGSLQIACIASKRAAKIYGLNVLMEGIEDDENITTRYALISKSQSTPERHLNPKTSISVTCKNQVGAFHKVLACFALRDINLLKVESRPSARSVSLAKPWEYVLYVDIDASLADTNLQKALEHLSEFSSVVLLGSYPRYQPPVEPVLGALGIGM
jgi:prephenate dehydratase